MFIPYIEIGDSGMREYGGAGSGVRLEKLNSCVLVVSTHSHPISRRISNV